MLEVAAPDVHDGDGPADQIATLGGGGAATAPAGPADAPAPATDLPGSHLHVCHCAHTHGSLTTPVNALAAAAEQDQRLLSMAARAPDDVDLEVRIRPPIG